MYLEIDVYKRYIQVAIMDKAGKIVEKFHTLNSLRKVWILTAPTGFMNGRRRFDVVEHLSEAELGTAINEAQQTDEAE